MQTGRILFLGDVVGEPGRRAVRQELDGLRKEFFVDAVIVNGENSAGGRGITAKIAKAFFQVGTDVITLGDHVWDQQETASYLQEESRIIRPLNYPEGTPGSGVTVVEIDWNDESVEGLGKMAVIQVQGRTFMRQALENPFLLIEGVLKHLKAQGVKVIVVDVHAEATSEKIAFGWFLDGQVSAVLGTHTHVQTADERVLPEGTAFICDVGMCGPRDSVLGRSVDPVVQSFRTLLPKRFPVAKWPVIVSGVVIEVELETGKALSIERVNRVVERRV